MPKQNFMTVSVSDNIQLMFDEFVRLKNTTKTAAFNDMVELYMLANDEDLYLNLKKKYLNVEGVKEMIISKDEVLEPVEFLYDTFIFMKLGYSSDNKGITYNGLETMEIYIQDEETRGYTWFSTESLYFGMKKKQVEIFNEKISMGHTVKILFAIGNNAGGNNDIAFSAEVLEIVSHQTPSPAPENSYPNIWKGSEARIWIKIKNLKEETDITADRLIVKSTGGLLKPIISNSQYHFGYVTLRS